MVKAEDVLRRERVAMRAAEVFIVGIGMGAVCVVVELWTVSDCRY